MRGRLLLIAMLFGILAYSAAAQVAPFTIYFVEPVDGANFPFGQSVNFSVNVTSPHNVSYVAVELENNGSTFRYTMVQNPNATEQWGFQTSFRGSSPINYSVVTIINATNGAQARINRTIIVGVNPPAPLAVRIVDLSGPSGYHTHHPQYIRVNATTGGSLTSLGVQLNGPVSRSASLHLVENQTWNFTVLVPGNYSLVVSGQDNNSNSNVSTYNFTVNGYDGDGDGVDDHLDPVVGDERNLTVRGTGSLSLMVNGSNSIDGNHSGMQDLKVIENGVPLLNFTHNFNASDPLNLSGIQIARGNNSVVVDLESIMESGATKTLYLQDSNLIDLCVLNGPVTRKNQSSGPDIAINFSVQCNRPNEIHFYDCLGNSTGVTKNGVTCIDRGNYIEVQNLSFSGIKGTPQASMTSPSANSVWTDYYKFGIEDDTFCVGRPSKITLTTINRFRNTMHTTVTLYKGREQRITGTVGEYVTDRDGSLFVTFDEAGDYLLHAQKRGFSPADIKLEVRDCSAAAVCSVNVHCMANEYCNDGVCEALSCPYTHSHQCVECTRDAHCSSGRCIANSCSSGQTESSTYTHNNVYGLREDVQDIVLASVEAPLQIVRNVESSCSLFGYACSSLVTMLLIAVLGLGLAGSGVVLDELDV